jgi:hypothetical protein
MEKRDISVPIDYNNIPDILTSNYNIVIPDQVLEDALQEQKQENPLELLVLYNERWHYQSQVLSQIVEAFGLSYDQIL